MTNKTRQRLIKMLMYVLAGFTIAFFWHKVKK